MRTRNHGITALVAGGIAVALTAGAVALDDDGLALKVESLKEQAGLKVVVFSVTNAGPERASTVVVGCDGYSADGQPLATTSAGVYEVEAGKTAIGEAAFTDRSIAKADCRVTSVIR